MRSKVGEKQRHRAGSMRLTRVPSHYGHLMISQARQDGRGRCGSYQRGGDPQDHAFRPGQDGRTASRRDGAENAGSSGPAEDAVGQRLACTSGRTGYHRGQRPCERCGAHGYRAAR